MRENRYECGGLRHKHDIERIVDLEARLEAMERIVSAAKDLVYEAQVRPQYVSEGIDILRAAIAAQQKTGQ